MPGRATTVNHPIAPLLLGCAHGRYLSLSPRASRLGHQEPETVAGPRVAAQAICVRGGSPGATEREATVCGWNPRPHPSVSRATEHAGALGASEQHQDHNIQMDS